MKFIIDLPKGAVRDGKLRFWGESEPECKWFDTGFTATPYEEPSDTAEDAWNFAGRLFGYSDDAILEEEIGDCYGMSEPYDILDHMSYKEAKEQYEAWKKEKDEIHVGDEVVWDNAEPFVVLVVGESDKYPYFKGITASGMFAEGGVKYKKTGRHFPEVAELLKKMRETE